ncbi:hypothetical protein OE88DRAFT_730619 [Heliocybe sulcata]|uniref:F-box domain-containing protein n=1 Tax=Heliocybe sulcata TaxID=5364 RepID=A0A5C3MS17_9AGAM|nr:hypothetical protein OE88DRAFT_730619 [Heliocybe sulcata]
MPLHHLPLDLHVQIFQYLPIDDILRLRLVSKDMCTVLSLRYIWHSAIMKALEVVPVPQIFNNLCNMPTEALRFEAVRSFKLEKAWRKEDSIPCSVKEIPAFHDMVYLELLPGGDWLATIACDGSVCLQHVLEPAPRITKEGIGVSLQNMTSATSNSSKLDSLLVITGRNETDASSHVFLYWIDTRIPCMEPVLNLKLPVNILTASAGFGVLAVGAVLGEEEFIHVMLIDEYTGKRLGRDMVIDVQLTGSMEDSTLSILSRDYLFICCSFGFSLHRIPEPEKGEEDGDPRMIQAKASWSLKLELTLVPPLSSPVLWGQARRPMAVFLLDYRELHALNLAVLPTASHIKVPLPVQVDGDLTSLGTHRGVWWNRRSLSADRRLLQLWTEDYPVVVGSLLVPREEDEEVEYLSLDEWSGRVCLLLRRKGEKARILLVDSVGTSVA